MEIAIHLGVHCTDDERLLRCLRANAAKLAAAGVAVPEPDAYRTLMRDAANTLQGHAASPETEEIMLEQILDEAETANRMILSWDNFLSFPQWVLRGRLYPAAGDRCRALRLTFPAHDVGFCMAIRNPATFLPELCARKRGKPVEEMLGDTDVMGLRWSDTISDILARNPDTPLVVWCDEDTPLIWPEVLEHVSGLPDGTELQGWDDLLHHLMDEEGFRRLHSTLTEPPVPDAARRRQIIGNLLAEFVRPEAVEQEFEMPGWDQSTVDRLTETYENDIRRIANLPGVTFITP